MPARSFVALWPPPEVAAVLEDHPRPALLGIRWTTPEQWHVTLRFLGAVDEALLDPLAAALVEGLDGAGPAVAALGPTTRRLGRSVLVAPVAGVERLAAVALAATGGLVPDVDPRPFRGHLTLARARRGASVPAALAGVPLSASWPVAAVSLVRSTLQPAGAVYEEIARVTLPEGA